jgi:glycosyltransferase involved in cell wall biosynthesis
MYKVGVIIPDRNDRPLFLDNCLRMLESQTLQPSIIKLVNDKPLSNECDITYRYKTGYDRLRGRGLDVIALIENDDWYSPDYLETMVKEWDKQGRPNLLGTDHTIYYHIKENLYFFMNHKSRSSAMSTLIKPDMEFKWPADSEPYTDIHLWHYVKGIIFHPEKTICMGIKHGIGLCGGKSHIDRMNRYDHQDKDLSFLRSKIDAESFNFYTNYFKNV